MDQTAPTRLLILEDEATDAELAVHRLERNGIHCLWKRVATRAVFSRALHEFRPDIILSDYTLPGFDGLAALEIAQREAPETPFVFLSGTMGEELAIEALKRGAMDYVLKTNPVRLPPAVRRALEQAEERRARRTAEERVHRLTRVLQLLSGVNAVVARTHERMDLLQEVCRLATEVGGYNSAVVAMIEPGTRTARPAAWSGAVSEAMDRLRFTIAERPEHDTSAIGTVLRSGEVFMSGPSSRACSETDGPDGPVQSSSHATVVLPLVVDGTPVGAFELTSGQTELLGDEELRMLHEIAANVSFALQYLHKEDAVRFLSYFDPMTGLAKRSLLCERLAQRLARYAAPSPGPAVVVFDIKGLSAVNDSFGRHIGDALLQLVAFGKLHAEVQACT